MTDDEIKRARVLVQAGFEIPPDTALALLDQLVAAKKDADRYRWIRRQKENLMVLFPEHDIAFGLADVATALTNEALDAAVDEMIAKENA